MPSLCLSFDFLANGSLPSEGAEMVFRGLVAQQPDGCLRLLGVVMVRLVFVNFSKSPPNYCIPFHSDVRKPRSKSSAYF